jgi:hypothetical protein
MRDGDPLKEENREKTKVAPLAKRGKTKCYEIRKAQERAATDRSEDETTERQERTTGRGGAEKVAPIVKRTPHGRKARPRKAPEDQRNYPDWRAAGGKYLKNRHDIEATAIAERIWTQFFVRGLNPKEASDRAEMVYRTTRLAAPPWPKKK